MSLVKKKPDYARDYFYINRKFLNFAGLWPPKNPSKFVDYSYNAYRIFMYIASVAICVPSVFLGVIEQRHQIDNMIRTLNLFSNVFMGAVKCVFWAFRGNNIRRIMETLESEDFQYEDCGDFKPGLLTKRAKATGSRYGLAYFVLAQMTLVILYWFDYARAFWYLYKDLPITNVTSFKELPYYTYIPFKYDTPLKYLMAMTFQCVPFYMYGFSLIGIDTLFMNIMNFVGVHLDILNGAFRSMRKRCLMKIKGPALTRDGLYNSDELEFQMMGEMKKSIKHLETIIRVRDDLERNYNLVILGQVLGLLYILCSCLLLVSTTPVRTTKFVNEVVYLLTMYCQLVLLCWFGNTITLKASVLSQAIWESEWMGTRKPYQTCMLLTMIRMQKTFCLTVGKFSQLTLVTFISILKGSYSFYTVLKRANANEY